MHHGTSLCNFMIILPRHRSNDAIFQLGSLEQCCRYDDSCNMQCTWYLTEAICNNRAALCLRTREHVLCSTRHFSTRVGTHRPLPPHSDIPGHQTSLLFRLLTAAADLLVDVPLCKTSSSPTSSIVPLPILQHTGCHHEVRQVP